MKKILTIIALVFAGTTQSFGQKINAEKSTANFKIGNMGSVRTVTGSFKGMEGTVNFNPDNLSSSDFDVCINPATVNTGIETRDKHLQTAGFFDVAKYFTICFKSSEITKTAEGFLTKGKLTMHGVTKEVEIPFSYSQNVFIGTFKVKRLDYSVGGSGTFMVGDEAEVIITCVLD